MRKRQPRIERENYVIYCATNIINNKSYIGQTYDFEHRRKQHIKDAHNAKHNRVRAFHSAIRYYGEGNFVWNLIEQVTSVDEANDAEEFYISYLNTMAPYGYNLHPGGRNKSPCQETRDKISATLKRVGTILSNKGPAHPNYGRKYTKEELLNQSEKLAGENGPGVKLTSQQVRGIYQDGLNGLTAVELSFKYEIGKSAVSNILHKRSWTKELADMPDYTTKLLYNSIIKDEDVKNILLEGYDLNIIRPKKMPPGKNFKYSKTQSELCQQIAAKYGVTYLNIYDILRGNRSAKLYDELILNYNISF